MDRLFFLSHIPTAPATPPFLLLPLGVSVFLSVGCLYLYIVRLFRSPTASLSMSQCLSAQAPNVPRPVPSLWLRLGLSVVVFWSVCFCFSLLSFCFTVFVCSFYTPISVAEPVSVFDSVVRLCLSICVYVPSAPLTLSSLWLGLPVSVCGMSVSLTVCVLPTAPHTLLCLWLALSVSVSVYVCEFVCVSLCYYFYYYYNYCYLILLYLFIFTLQWRTNLEKTRPWRANP